MIRLVIVDDHPVVRDGLRTILSARDDITVCGEAGDGPAAVALVGEVRPDVVLMDLRMPDGDGASAIEELSRRGDPARVVVLTTYDTDAEILRAVRAGALGYLLKNATPDEVVGAVRAAAEGGSALAAPVAARLLAHVRGATPQPALSDRELEVLRVVARGRNNRECAAELFISQATVKTHLLHIYEKLGVTDRAAAAAVAAAFERGLLSGG
ncbi:response regulator transcription factor [Actinoplanes sp. CA-131856]